MLQINQYVYEHFTKMKKYLNFVLTMIKEKHCLKGHYLEHLRF